MKDQALALKKQYEADYYFMDPRSRRNFIAKCKRLANKIDPSTANGDESLAMMILDVIEMRSGCTIWKR